MRREDIVCRRGLRRSAGIGAVVLGLAASLGLVGPGAAEAAGGPGIDEPGPMVLPVPLERAGTYVGWGEGTDRGQWDLPAELEGVPLREVAAANNVTLALTAAGRVVAWGMDPASHIEALPAAVASMEVVDLVATNANAGVVGADGRVLVWGTSALYGDPTDVPPELRQPAAPGEPRVVQLALGDRNGFALKDDGTVVAWGEGDEAAGGAYAGLLEVPDGLRATQITASGNRVYALTTQRTVVAWGDVSTSCVYGCPPPAVQVPDSMRAVAAVSGGAWGLRADGSLIAWGQNAGSWPLPDLGDGSAVAIAGSDDVLLALDEDGMLHPGDRAGSAVTVPPSLVGKTIAQFSGGFDNIGVIVTQMLSAAPPTVAGPAQVGSGTLTATPGTFSGAPDQVSSQWLVNGSPVGTPVVGATTPGSLSLAGYPAGTTIAYRSTATKAGEETVTSTSAAVTLAAASAVKSTPLVGVQVTKAPTMKKAGTVTVTVTGGAIATGQVTVTASGKIAKKGKKAKKKTFTVTGVLANGTAVVKVKKLKNAKGKWTFTVSYAGDATHNAAVGPPVKVKVKKR